MYTREVGCKHCSEDVCQECSRVCVGFWMVYKGYGGFIMEVVKIEDMVTHRVYVRCVQSMMGVFKVYGQ